MKLSKCMAIARPQGTIRQHKQVKTENHSDDYSQEEIQKAITWGIAGAFSGAIPVLGTITNTLAIENDKWLSKCDLPIAAPMAAAGWMASTAGNMLAPVALLGGRRDIAVALTATSSLFGAVWWAANGLNQAR